MRDNKIKSTDLGRCNGDALPIKTVNYDSLIVRMRQHQSSLAAIVAMTGKSVPSILKVLGLNFESVPPEEYQTAVDYYNMNCSRACGLNRAIGA